MHLSRHAEFEPYVTADDSTIREWAGPGYSPPRNQSLAEATVAPGGQPSPSTTAVEELHPVSAGRGLL